MLLRPESWVALEAWRDGVTVLPEISRRTEVFLRAPGDPVMDTLLWRGDLLGVMTFCTFVAPVRDSEEDTRLMLTRSAVASWGTDRRFLRLSVDSVLVVERRWLHWLSAL